MSNDTNLTVRPGEEDNHDGLTDEAVLHYQKLAAEEKKKSRGLSGPLPGEGATYTGAAGLGMGAVAFEDRQLHAEVGGVERADDPWGTDEDDYSVPSAVTGAEDDHEDRRKRGKGAMALRGSGTRGGSKSDGSGLAGGAPMMGAPGATVGGVGGVGGVGAQPMGGAMPGAQLGLAQNGAVGSMPVGMLQNAQNSSRAATGAVYAPPAGAGPQAASAGPGVYDPEFLREALKANGFTREALDEKTPGVGGIDLVDTDGDGVPDTPRAEAEKSARERGATNPGGMLPGPLPIGGNINGPGPAPTTPGTNPGATTPGTNPPGDQSRPRDDHAGVSHHARPPASGHDSASRHQPDSQRWTGLPSESSSRHTARHHDADQRAFHRADRRGWVHADEPGRQGHRLRAADPDLLGKRPQRIFGEFRRSAFRLQAVGGRCREHGPSGGRDHLDGEPRDDVRAHDRPGADLPVCRRLLPRLRQPVG